MKDLLVTGGIALFLVLIIQRTYIISPNSLATRNKDRLCYVLMFLVLSLFIGMRTSYNDTYNYITAYRQTETLPELLLHFDVTLGDNPGYLITNSFLKSRNISTQGWILFYSMIAIGAALFFLQQYSDNLYLAIFLFFTTNAYTFCAAAIKQTVAMGFAYLAVYYALKHKWILFSVWLAIAALFHPYVLVFLLVPFLTFRPWSKWTYVLLAVFLVIGFSLEALLGTIVDMAAMIGDNYSEEKLVGEGISIFRVLVSNVPLLLSFLYRKQLFANSSKENNLMINLAMVNGAIMFVGLFGKAIYFSRLSSFFTIAQCIALPWILKKLPPSHKRIYTILMIVGYLGFFYYANVMATSFDNDFSRITVLEYLTSISGN